MPAWARLRGPVLLAFALAAGIGRLAGRKWNSRAPTARRPRVIVRSAAVGGEHDSTARLSAPRWRGPYVITVKPHMTGVKQNLIDTSTGARMRSYPLRSGSNDTDRRHQFNFLGTVSA